MPAGGDLERALGALLPLDVLEVDERAVALAHLRLRREVTRNTVEGYISIFKRGMKGVYQHCSEKHLHRYLSEFDFRYSHRVALGYTDEARSFMALKGIVGKRLTYRGRVAIQ